MKRAVLRRGPFVALRLLLPDVAGAFVTVVAAVAGPSGFAEPSGSGMFNVSADAVGVALGNGAFSFCGGVRRQPVLASKKSVAPSPTSVLRAQIAPVEHRATRVRYSNRGRVVRIFVLLIVFFISRLLVAAIYA